MAISEKDVKKLWGLAAGRCSRPGCAAECVKFLNGEDPIVIGEMAHVIAKKPDGPRGGQAAGDDTYDNLILLCPTHHTEVDKAPLAFPVALLHEWKKTHEEHVRASFQSPRFQNSRELGLAIRRLLVANHVTWNRYGPESEEARRNPLSNLHRFWGFRKLDTIVPNNRRVIEIIEQNKEMLDIDDFKICAAFVEHAEGFERNCYERLEGVPQFPLEFDKLITRLSER